MNIMKSLSSFQIALCMTVGFLIGGCEDAVQLDASDISLGQEYTTNTSVLESAGTYTNPVLDFSGDPFCMKHNGQFYLYLPQNGPEPGGKVVCYTSADLINWSTEGVVYDNAGHDYNGQTATGLWAPEVLVKDGMFYLYVVNNMSDPLDDRVGDKDIVVIEGNSPTSFTGSRKVLLDGDYAFIDPSPFLDTSDGRLYLTYKKRGAYGTGTQINVRPMSDPQNFSGNSVRVFHDNDIPDSYNILEHPHILYKNGKYFLFFSKGSGSKTTYAIDYAVGNDPMGPFTYKENLFKSSADLSGDLSQKVISPGGSSIVRDGSGQAYIVYRQKTTTQDTFGDRVVCVDKVTIDAANSTVTASPSKGVARTAPVPL